MPDRLDLSGKTVNGMLCLRFAGMSNNGKSLWIFRCHCGDEFTALGSNVKNKRTNSCGICVKTPDLTGVRVNNWLVLGRAGFRDKKDKRVATWKCKCSCGAIKNLSTADININKSKSCRTCISEEESGYNYIWTRYKSEAKTRGKSFTLSKDEFRRLITSNCFYCGCGPSNKKKLKRKKLAHIVYNGIDRVDSDKGYYMNNCVPCCYQCNVAKSDFSQEDFFKWVMRVMTHSGLIKAKADGKIELEYLRETIASDKASESGSGWGE